MADDEIDVEGEFEAGGGLYDANELPSKSANLLPEFTNPPWMLEQGWSLDNGMDEKSKATIEKMLLEEQQYINGHKKCKYLGINKSVLLIKTSSTQGQKGHETTTKCHWTEEEKSLFSKGMEKYGRSWSKISQLIPSRTTMQVKNYAQQYLKNLAKRNERHSLPCTATTSLAAEECASTVSTCCPTDVVATVTTAVPTITARPPPSRSPAIHRPKSRKIRLPPSQHTNQQTGSVSNNGEKIILHRSHVRSTLTTVNDVLCGNNPALGSSPKGKAVSQVNVAKAEHDSLSESSTRNTTVVKDEANDSESEEIDVDIENDDDEVGNAILLSRSASPSSVYNKLLQQASVAEDKTHDSVQDPATFASVKEQTLEVINDLHEHDEVSNNLVKSEASTPVDCDKVVSPSSITEGTEAVSGAEDEQGPFVDNEEYRELKHIVNGVTSSSGEVFEFPIPIEEKVLQANSITEEEKKIHSEFFDGRPMKTADRYLKIRNYIFDCWKKSQPGYLNKTCVRPGLKNCGDVNCIGRIHAYLECIGAINFGCEQAAYNNGGRGLVTVSRNKHSGKEHPLSPPAARLEAVRPRKRRIRDSGGHWVDEKELEGKTIEHKPETKGAWQMKSGRSAKTVYDPFKLVPCLPFSQDKQAPFSVEVLSTALAVMDIHAHISRTEVIGMLGGQYDHHSSHLTISMAIPCKSISTGMQCEMDPVSQTHASEQLADVGMQVVGWYHSHPTFAPNPSVRDIETQQKFQYWFSKDGNHFVGLIISPYAPQNTNVISDIQCLTIGEEVARQYLCNTPYQFGYKVTYRDNMREILGPASELAERYSSYVNRVALSCVYKPSLGITCLSKMLQSVKHRLEPRHSEQPAPGSRGKVDDVLHWLEQIFLDKFSDTSTTSISDVDISPTITTVPPTDEDVQV